MSMQSIVTSKTDVQLKPAPIERSWIIDGEPLAQNAVLSRSSDGLATTLVWECSAGKFNWHYDIDETIYILEGSAIIGSDTMTPRRFGPGDVVFFRKGAHARWHVESKVRKVAFCRRVQPRIIALALRIASRLKRMMVSRPAAASLMSAG